MISDAAYIELSLAVGISSSLTYDAVEREANIYQAYKKALYLLGYTSASRKALLRKLVDKGCDAEYSSIALDRLEANGMLNEMDFALREGEKSALRVFYEPWYYPQAGVTYAWTTSDEDVATVQNGVVQAVACGEAVVCLEVYTNGIKTEVQ